MVFPRTLHENPATKTDHTNPQSLRGSNYPTKEEHAVQPHAKRTLREEHFARNQRVCFSVSPAQVNLLGTEVGKGRGDNQKLILGTGPSAHHSEYGLSYCVMVSSCLVAGNHSCATGLC